MEEPPKLFPMSTKVGSEPVVRPLMRCSVVVGGSAYALKRNERVGCFSVSCLGRLSTLWWFGEAGRGGSGEIKSKRSESMMRRTARLWVGVRAQLARLQEE